MSKHIYFSVLFIDGHTGYNATTLPLWEAIQKYIPQDNIKIIKIITRDEYNEKTSLN